jgi:hypothetical protein
MGRNRLYKTNADKQRAYRRRKGWARRARKVTQVGPSVDAIREDALARFKADPTKCYQRHIREVMAENDPRPPLPNLKSAAVSQIANTLAAAIILRFEWLGTMAIGTRFCYGLWPSDKLHPAADLLGAVCFTKGGNRAALESVAPYDRAIILARGACSMRAGRNAASFLISRACKMAARDHGFTHFLAYTDPEAGERGTIYRALNWQFLGMSEQGPKTTFKGPHGARISSYDFNDNAAWKFRALGWDGEQSKYVFLRSLPGWTEERESKKLRWLYEVNTKK